MIFLSLFFQINFSFGLKADETFFFSFRKSTIPTFKFYFHGSFEPFLMVTHLSQLPWSGEVQVSRLFRQFTAQCSATHRLTGKIILTSLSLLT